MRLTWQEHLAWCKARALAYLPGDPAQAVASMASDLVKHDDAPSVHAISVMVAAAAFGDKRPETIRRWIQDWN